MLYFNNTISDFGEILSSIEIIDNYSSFILSSFIMFIILNMTTCLFIFLGNNIITYWFRRKHNPPAIEIRSPKPIFIVNSLPAKKKYDKILVNKSLVWENKIVNKDLFFHYS